MSNSPYRNRILPAILRAKRAVDRTTIACSDCDFFFFVVRTIAMGPYLSNGKPVWVRGRNAIFSLTIEVILKKMLLPKIKNKINIGTTGKGIISEMPILLKPRKLRYGGTERKLLETFADKSYINY